MIVRSKHDEDHSVKKRSGFWRNSTYEEPTWVSLAWILGPSAMAAVAMYLVLG